jgi:hypothetical protein
MAADPGQNDQRPSLPEGLLLECVVTTLNPDGGVRVSPMGPIVDRCFTRALLRPYPPSETLDNLRRTKHGVLHVTDDIDLISRAALGQLDQPPTTSPTLDGRGAILNDACRWYALEVLNLDEQPAPALVDCLVTDSGRLRDFIGFNRAMHAVIEATILATRLEYLPHDQILAQLGQLALAVEKTGGRRERDSFERIRRYVQERIGAA